MRLEREPVFKSDIEAKAGSMLGKLLKNVQRGITRLLLPWIAMIVTTKPYNRKRSLLLDRLIYLSER